jgi:hypothetical protein
MPIELLSVVLSQQKSATALFMTMSACWIASLKGDFLD